MLLLEPVIRNVSIIPVVGKLARLALLVLVISWSTGDSKLHAQGGNVGSFGTLGGVEPTGQYPPDTYYIALETYRTGDLRRAISMFDLVNTRKDINGRWIDAIPVLAMEAECYWHLGNLPAVHERLDEVFRIAIRHRGWLARVNWDAALQPNIQRAPEPGLWPAASGVRRLPVADRIQIGSGAALNAQTFQRGGVVQELTVRTMDVVEIMRGLAIAAYRRRVLLGPLAKQDPLASQLLESTKYPSGLNTPIGRSLIGSMRATERFSLAEDQQAINDAAQKVMLNGGVHPLTSIAMLGQASAIAGTDKPAGAVAVAGDVANSAAALGQPEWVGEAMQLAAGCAQTAEQAEMVRQLATTAATSLNRTSRLACLHCLVAASDAAITAGRLDAAATTLSQAQTLSSRRDVTQPRIDAYGAYVAARLAAANGHSIGLSSPTELDQALSLVGKFAVDWRDRNRLLVTTPTTYQLSLLRQSVGNSRGGRTNETLLESYADDPPAEVWRRDAVDAISLLLTDRVDLLVRQVQLAATGEYGEQVLLRANDLFAGRFLSRLPLAGRIARVRTIATQDDSLLDNESIEFRKQAGPAMAQLRQAAQAVPAGGQAVDQRLEASACAIALGRYPIPQSFPPRLVEKSPLAKLPPRTGLLMFVDAGNKAFATFSGEGKTVMWTIAGSARLPTDIAGLLRKVGVGKPRGNRLPDDQSWRTDAVALRSRLVPDEQIFSGNQFDEIVIVPDGPLWYLPFEMLPVAGEDSALIGDALRIRYAPTPSLAMQPSALPSNNRAIGIYADQYFAPRDPELSESIAKSILDVCEQPVRLPDAAKTPTGLLGNSIGHLVVASPRAANVANPLNLNIAPYDQGQALGTLAGWMRLPHTAPRSVILGGFRTPIDVGKVGQGDEMFMTLCGLHAAGVRSVLMSRWAVGGESSAIVLREVVQELPFAGLMESWQRARMVLRRTQLDPAGEPLLMQAEHDRDDLAGDQPLFWAGYLVSAPPQTDAGNQP